MRTRPTARRMRPSMAAFSGADGAVRLLTRPLPRPAASRAPTLPRTSPLAPQLSRVTTFVGLVYRLRATQRLLFRCSGRQLRRPRLAFPWRQRLGEHASRDAGLVVRRPAWPTREAVSGRTPSQLPSPTSWMRDPVDEGRGVSVRVGACRVAPPPVRVSRRPCRADMVGCLSTCVVVDHVGRGGRVGRVGRVGLAGLNGKVSHVRPVGVLG